MNERAGHSCSWSLFFLLQGWIWVWHDDVIKWKHFPRYWPSVRGIHRSPVNSPHKGQWRGALVFTLIYAWTNGRSHNRDAGDLRCHPAHYDVTVMIKSFDSRTSQVPGACWCHGLVTFSSLLGFCEGNLRVIGGFPSQRASKMLIFDIVSLCC